MRTEPRNEARDLTAGEGFALALVVITVGIAAMAALYNLFTAIDRILF